jgi:DNA-binding protein
MNKPLLIGAGALVLFSAGALVGRGTAPAKVITKDQIVEHTVTVQAVKTASEDSRASEKDVAKDVTRTVTRFPDGRTEVRTVDRSKTETKAVEVRTVVQEKIVQVESVRTETHERLVLRRPDWSVGLQAGASVPSLLGRPSTTLLPLPGVYRSAVFGLSIERRIFGDLYAGVHANSQGVIGVGIHYAW